MKKYLIIMGLIVLSIQYARSQGCVAIRSTGGFCTRDQAAHSDERAWLLSANSRYFKSFRHFVGTEERKERLEQGTEVINYTYSLDLALTRNFKNGWSVFFDLPVISNARSSMYEHGGNGAKNARHYTRSFGIGDVRFGAYKWILDPAQMPTWNVQVGLGIKLPTGDYKYQDYFVKNDTTRILGPVDQSIQLGDGGTGVTAEVNAFYNITNVFGVFGNLYYLANPREQNGVSTGRGQAPSAVNVKYGNDVMSVPDQYMLRAGITAKLNRLTISGGIRKEEIPSEDLFGGSRGFRRPGYVISLEPGLNYQLNRATFYAYVPVAIKRNRTQSAFDKRRTAGEGTHFQGDAAFSDYLVNIGCSFTLNASR
jgi:hypothetical protein